MHFTARSVAAHFVQWGVVVVLKRAVPVDLPPVGLITRRGQRAAGDADDGVVGGVLAGGGSDGCCGAHPPAQLKKICLPAPFLPQQTDDLSPYPLTPSTCPCPPLHPLQRSLSQTLGCCVVYCVPKTAWMLRRTRLGRCSAWRR